MISLVDPARLPARLDYVRDVIHAFNERGFDALNPKWSGGRRRKIGDRIRKWICLIARTSPAECGITAFSPGVGRLTDGDGDRAGPVPGYFKVSFGGQAFHRPRPSSCCRRPRSALATT